MLKRHRTSDSRRREGFTLLEVVVAFGIFGVGMLSLTAMQLHAMRAGSSGRHTSQAATIAQTRMEQLQRLRWTNAALAPNDTWSALFTVNNTVQGSPNQVEQVYTRDERVSNVVDGWTRTIDVRVSWDEENRPNRSVTLSSIRFNRTGL
jgi:Tfp pilus assembly protein PilV